VINVLSNISSKYIYSPSSSLIDGFDVDDDDDDDDDDGVSNLINFIKCVSNIYNITIKCPEYASTKPQNDDDDDVV
jgi:hypothetical protein